MDDRNGRTYPTKEDAIRDGVPEEHIVELTGPIAAIQRLSRLAQRHQATPPWPGPAKPKRRSRIRPNLARAERLRKSRRLMAKASRKRNRA